MLDFDKVCDKVCDKGSSENALGTAPNELNTYLEQTKKRKV